MYTYILTLNRIYIDYYSGDETYYPEDKCQFSDSSFWAARFRLMLDLTETQIKSTIVDFNEISIQLSTNEEEEPLFLGAWTLKQGRNYKWDWQTEADFLEKHHLYRASDKELLAIEQAFHQSPQIKKDPAAMANLRNELNDFTKKYADSIQDYAPEIGLLYYFLEDKVQACEYFMQCPMTYHEDFAYKVVKSLFWYDKDIYRQYLKMYDEVYKGYRPPFLR